MGNIIFDLLVICILFFFVFKYIFLKFLADLRLLIFLKKDGIATKGIIRSIAPVQDSDAVKTYKILVEFKTLQGEIHNFTPRDGRWRKPYLGDEVDVKYAENHPDISIIDDKETNYYILIRAAFLLIAGICITVNLVSTLSRL